MSLLAIVAVTVAAQANGIALVNEDFLKANLTYDITAEDKTGVCCCYNNHCLAFDAYTTCIVSKEPEEDCPKAVHEKGGWRVAKPNDIGGWPARHGPAVHNLPKKSACEKQALVMKEVARYAGLEGGVPPRVLDALKVGAHLIGQFQHYSLVKNAGDKALLHGPLQIKTNFPTELKSTMETLRASKEDHPAAAQMLHKLEALREVAESKTEAECVGTGSGSEQTCEKQDIKVCERVLFWESDEQACLIGIVGEIDSGKKKAHVWHRAMGAGFGGAAEESMKGVKGCLRRPPQDMPTLPDYDGFSPKECAA